MAFMDRLAMNPSNNFSGIYGQSRPENDNDILSVVSRLKDREMQDYKDKANFNADLSLRQEQRMRELFDPVKKLNIQDMNQDPIIRNYLTPDQQIEKEQQLQKPQLDLENQKLSQQNKFGQEALNIKSAQEKLNETRNTQINEDRDLERQRKINETNMKIEEANKKIELAQQALASKTANSEAQLQAHKDMAAAVEERHKLELENRQYEFNITNDLHKKKIEELESRLKQQQNTETTTEINPEGTKRTVTTKRGSEAINAPVKNPDGTYTVTAPDGRKGIIPGNKLSDWLANHQSGGE